MNIIAAKSVAIEVATATGDAKFAAKMGALFAAFCAKHPDAISPHPDLAVAAFRTYCLNAEAAGFFNN